jgi:hypothetical protein
MIDKLLKKEEDFQPYLKKNKYTFIGPQKHLQEFIRLVHEQNPNPTGKNDLHCSLKNKNCIFKALATLPENTALTIYVATETSPVSTWVPAWEITDYCRTRNIDFKLWD